MIKIIISTLLILPSLALAQDSDAVLEVETSIVSIGQATGRCLHNLEVETNEGIRICVRNAYWAYDELLNTQYQRVMSDNNISQIGKDLLRESSLAWIEYKSIQCQWQSISPGGKNLHIELTTCLNGLTINRIMEIVRRHYQD